VILQNYTASPQTFAVHAVIGGTLPRVRRVTLAADAFVGLGPDDIPVLVGELADLAVCWGSGPPAVLVFLLFGSDFVIEPPVASFFAPESPAAQRGAPQGQRGTAGVQGGAAASPSPGPRLDASGMR
jgi:hypothetical protein